MWVALPGAAGQGYVRDILFVLGIEEGTKPSDTQEEHRLQTGRTRIDTGSMPDSRKIPASGGWGDKGKQMWYTGSMKKETQPAGKLWQAVCFLDQFSKSSSSALKVSGAAFARSAFT